jgi:hypothetical protein
MGPLTLGRLALAGTRTDVLRGVLTAASAGLAGLAMLAAGTVLSIDGSAPAYTNNLLVEPGLRPGVTTALVLLCVPVLALAGQCARLGGPARDRRLAAIRLAGATPRQVAAIAVAETALAATVGVGLGTAVFLAGRSALHRPGPDGRLPLPTDVLPPAWGLAAICAGIPVLAGLLAVVQLRRVTLSPMGVFRRVPRTRSPRPWPFVLVIAGVALLFGLDAYMDGHRDDRSILATSLLGLGGVLLASIGVIAGAGWMSYRTGRLLGRFARRPAALIAARRLTADPWAGSRTFATLLACLVFAGGAVGYRAHVTVMSGHRAALKREHDETIGRYVGPLPAEDAGFYLRTMSLIDLAVQVAAVIAALGLIVTIAEGVLSRRRANTSLVATGVPRASLAGSLAWQVLTPAVPATLLALTVGAVIARTRTDRGFEREAYDTVVCTADRATCADPATAAPFERTFRFPAVFDAVPVPLADLATTWGLAVAAVLVVIGVGLLTLRASTTVEELRTP